VNLVNKFPSIIISEDEKQEFQNYLELKGVQRYKKIEAALNGKVGTISYCMLSEHYRYDVKLRRQIFKSIALLEVAIKAYICNHYNIEHLQYSNFKDIINKVLGKGNKKFSGFMPKVKMLFNEKPINSLFEYVEESDFGQLIEVFMVLPDEQKEELFPNIQYLKENLYAIKELRNKACHHSITIGQELGTVYIDGMPKQGIQANIENLINLIPSRARGNIKRQFNECLIIDEEKDLTQDNQYNILGEYKAFFNGVEYGKNTVK